jgi:hypothetical protein
VKKILTREQTQTSKDRAARFVLNVLQDADGAQAIEDESLDDWAARKKITLTNPRPIPQRNCPLIHEGKENNMANKKPTMAELLEENESLKQENDDLSDQLDAVADIVAGDEEIEEGDSEEDSDSDSEDDDQD